MDTGAICLTLPAPFFDTLLVLLPIECDDEDCFLKPGIQDLPKLTFRLSELGQVVSLPLIDLAMNTTSGKTPLCLRRGNPIVYSEVNNIHSPEVISFGTMALRS